MSAKRQEQPQTETCEKCGQREGRIYGFYFGKTRTHTMTRRGHTNIHKIRTSIDGVESGAACDSCISRRRITRLIVFGSILAVGTGLALLAASLESYVPILKISTRQLRPIMVGLAGFLGMNPSLLQAIMLGVAAVLGLIGLRGLYKDLMAGKKKHGDYLIMALNKGALRKQGFKYFWS